MSDDGVGVIDDFTRSFKIAFRVTDKVVERMGAGKVVALDREKSGADSFVFLPSHANNVSFSGEFIIRSDLVIVATIRIRRECVIDVDSDRITNGASNWVARRWVRGHVHSSGDTCALRKLKEV